MIHCQGEVACGEAPAHLNKTTSSPNNEFLIQIIAGLGGGKGVRNKLSTQMKIIPSGRG
jgi:hypothetical protein